MFSGLKRIQTKRRRRSSGPPPPVPRQRMQPIRPERLSQIKGERPARLDLHIDAPKPLRCHIAERRRDELGARRPIRREAPPLVTFADSRPLAEVLGIGHGQVRNRRPELFAPGAGVDIHYGYRPSVQSFELAVIGAALTARRKYKRLRPPLVVNGDEAQSLLPPYDTAREATLDRVHGPLVQPRDPRRQARPRLDNLRQAVELLEDIDSISSRVFGARHPDTAANRSMLSSAREKLAQAKAPVARRTRSKAEES